MGLMDSAITNGFNARITANVGYFFGSTFPSFAFSDAT